MNASRIQKMFIMLYKAFLGGKIYSPMIVLIPVETRRRFNVDVLSDDILRRRVDVETTLCV